MDDSKADSRHIRGGWFSNMSFCLSLILLFILFRASSLIGLLRSVSVFPTVLLSLHTRGATPYDGQTSIHKISQYQYHATPYHTLH